MENLTLDPELKLFTRKETADILGVKPHTLEVWTSTKRYDLPYVKIGRLVKYRKCDIQKFIQENLSCQRRVK